MGTITKRYYSLKVEGKIKGDENSYVSYVAPVEVMGEYESLMYDCTSKLRWRLDGVEITSVNIKFVNEVTIEEEEESPM